MAAVKLLSTPAPEFPVPGHADMDMKANGKQKLSFMGKLVRMLAESDPAVVRWSDSGNSFLVLDCKRFTGEVLKNYLRTTNFASFVRQLNYYGFHKVTHSGDQKAPLFEFKHEKFSRDNVAAVGDIKRRLPVDGPCSPDVEALKTEMEQLRNKNRTLELELMRAQKAAADAKEKLAAAERKIAALSKDLPPVEAENIYARPGSKRRKRRETNGMDGSSSEAGATEVTSPVVPLTPHLALSTDACGQPSTSPSPFDAMNDMWTASPLCNPADSSTITVPPLSTGPVLSPEEVGVKQEAAAQVAAVVADVNPAGSEPAGEDDPMLALLDGFTLDWMSPPVTTPAPAPITAPRYPDLGDMNSDDFQTWTSSMVPGSSSPSNQNLDLPSRDVQQQVLAMSAEEQQRFLSKLVKAMIDNGSWSTSGPSTPAPEPSTDPAVISDDMVDDVPVLAPVSPLVAPTPDHKLTTPPRSCTQSPCGVTEHSTLSPMLPPATPSSAPSFLPPSPGRAALEARFSPQVLLACLLPLRLVQVALAKALMPVAQQHSTHSDLRDAVVRPPPYVAAH